MEEVEVKVAKDLTVMLPVLPKFVRSARGGGVMMELSELTEREIRKLGKAWTEAMIAKAKRRRR